MNTEEQRINWRDYAIWNDNSIQGFFGNGEEGYRWLSNFHPCEVADEFDIVYPSTEHAYQAMKTLDRKIREECLNMTCFQVKKWGQTIPIQEDWDNRKVDVMTNLNMQKFKLNPDLKEKLLDTGDKELVELNHWKDKFWGVYYKDGKGENNLGKILMLVRSEIRLLKVMDDF